MDTAIEVNRTPELIASEINSIKNQTRNMILLNSIEIGRRLVEAKEMVPHGEWGNWLESSVQYSHSTANNLMRIFEEYGDAQLTIFGATAKSQTLGNLSYTQAVALLGIPAEEREAFVEENDVQNMSTRELQQAIKERDEAREQLATAQTIASEKAEEARRLQDEKQQVETDWRDTERMLKEKLDDIKTLHSTLEEERASYKEAILKLRTSLSEAQQSGNNEEVQRLQESLNKAETALEESSHKIDELTHQLEEKPIDVPAVVEKIPEEIEAELNSLRNNQKSIASVKKFEVHFDILVKGFKDLLGTLAEIKEADSTGYIRYKEAVSTLITKMSEHL